MPLPQIKLREGADTSYHVGSDFTSFPELVLALHQGVLELGVGVATVRYIEDPEYRRVGFMLAKTNRVHWWEWQFLIQIKDLRASNGPASMQAVLTGRHLLLDRATLAGLFEQGLSPEKIEQALGVL